MSKVGEPQFEYERLCRIFGLSAVRSANVRYSLVLKTLESYLALVEQDIQRRTEASIFSTFGYENKFF